MKHYILAMVVLFFLAAPVMAAANLTVNQISYEEMWVNGTGFDDPSDTVTLSTMTNISVTPSPSGTYSYEITGMILPGDSLLKLNASPVKDELELYIQRYWPLAWTFDENCGIIGYLYDDPTKTVHVERSVPSVPSWIAGRFQTIRVKGGTDTPPSGRVYLNVTVQRDVDATGGSFNELVDIIAIPAGPYRIHATDGTNWDTNNTIILAPGQLHHIEITDPENITYPQTGELTRNTTGDYTNYTFGATGYDLEGKVVQTTFVWWSSNPYAGTIDYTGYFNATNVGHTEVYARSGAKESNHVIVYVNASLAKKTLTGEENFTLESGTANVTGTFNNSVNGTVTVQAVGNVTAATTVGLGAGYEFTSGAIVNVSATIHDALDGGKNGTVTIKLCVNDSELWAMGLARINVQIYVYNGSAGKWVELITTRIGATDCYTADISAYLSEATVGIGSKPAPTPSGGGGGDGTYPPGWFGTPTPTPTVTATATPQQGVTPTPAGSGVTPASTKPTAAGVAPTAAAGEEPTKKDIPGFTAVFAIAGLLAIAYVVMRRHR